MAPPIGSSRVPLDENIVPEFPRQFFPTFLEWLADGNVEQVLIADNRSGGAGTTVIFEVPANKTLFLTTAHMSSDNTSAAPGLEEVSLQVKNLNSDNRLLTHGHSKAGADHVSSSLNFPMPIKLDSGGLIRINTSGSQFTTVNLTGFLLDKKISIRTIR